MLGDMATQSEHECQNCKRLEAIVARQEVQIARLEAIVAELLDRIAKLEKNSSNSHKPPSSDIVKPKTDRPRSGKKRTRGAQPGHKRLDRTPFSQDQIDVTVSHTLNAGCPNCGGALLPTEQDSRVLLQQIELAPKPVIITEHRAPVYWCPQCQEHHHAQAPKNIRRAGLTGPRVKAFVACLKGAFHVSYSNVQEVLEDVMGVHISRGHLTDIIKQTSDALDPSYTELLEALPEQTRLNVDETGHKDSGKKFWSWVFRAPNFTVFKIDKSRGSQVLFEVLGKAFGGVLGCDYFSTYRKYMKDADVEVQFCLAHLIRDAKYLIKLGGRNGKYGKRLLGRLRDLFHILHQREQMPPATFEEAMEDLRKRLIHVATHPPWTKKAKNIAERFRQHGESYVRFITTPGIEPTNNVAEQALRFVVIQRRMTQGTRGLRGRTWSERIWTTVATCRQQGRSIYAHLHSSLEAHFAELPAPSLLHS